MIRRREARLTLLALAVLVNFVALFLEWWPGTLASVPLRASTAWQSLAHLHGHQWLLIAVHAGSVLLVAALLFGPRRS